MLLERIKVIELYWGNGMEFRFILACICKCLIRRRSKRVDSWCDFKKKWEESKKEQETGEEFWGKYNLDLRNVCLLEWDLCRKSIFICFVEWVLCRKSVFMFVFLKFILRFEWVLVESQSLYQYKYVALSEFLFRKVSL